MTKDQHHALAYFKLPIDKFLESLHEAAVDLSTDDLIAALAATPEIGNVNGWYGLGWCADVIADVLRDRQQELKERSD